MQTEGLSNKALCLSKAGSKAVQEKSTDTDIAALEIAPQLLSNLRALITELYIPVVESQEQQRRASEAKEEFLQVCHTCKNHTCKCLIPGMAHTIWPVGH